MQRSRAGARPGHDAEVELEIDLKTAVVGGKVAVSLRGEVTCARCEGRGATGSSPACPTCQGSGRITSQPREQGGFYTVTRLCTRCGGTGIDPARQCPECKGERTVERTRTIHISIPEGTLDGAVLRLAGLGGAGTGGAPSGDLLVHVRIRPDPQYHREGNDIHSDVVVPVTTAALGGKVALATLRGRVNLTVPAGTSSGTQLRLRGQGAPGGDHVAHVMIGLPERLTEKQKALFEQLAKEGA